MRTTPQRAGLDPEHRLLLACALAPGGACRSDALAQVDWSRLEGACTAHQLRPRLCAFLEAGADAGLAPAGLRERVKAIAHAHAGHGLMQAAELFRALEALAAAGVEAMPFKGPAFAMLLADGPRHRECADLDLLVRADDIARAAAALAPLGYEPALPAQALGSRWLRLATDELALARRADGGLVELHWRLGQRWYPAAIAIEDVWARAQTRELPGAQVAWPLAEDLLLLHISDGMKAGGTSLRWMADVAAIVGAHPGLEWEAIRAIAGRRGGLRTVRIALCAIERAAREAAAWAGFDWEWAPGATMIAAQCTALDLGAVDQVFARIRAGATLGAPTAHLRWALRVADRPLHVLGEAGRYLAGPAHADLRRMSTGPVSGLALRWRALRRRIGSAAG